MCQMTLTSVGLVRLLLHNTAGHAWLYVSQTYCYTIWDLRFSQWWWCRWHSFQLDHCVDWLVEAIMSERHAVFIFRAEVIMHAYQKRWLLSTNPHGNLTQKNIIRILLSCLTMYLRSDWHHLSLGIWIHYSYMVKVNWSCRNYKRPCKICSVVCDSTHSVSCIRKIFAIQHSAGYPATIFPHITLSHLFLFPKDQKKNANARVHTSCTAGIRCPPKIGIPEVFQLMAVPLKLPGVAQSV
jgi:hypothetical protein